MRSFADGNTAVSELAVRLEQPEALQELDDLELSLVAGGGAGGLVREVVINPSLVNP